VLLLISLYFCRDLYASTFSVPVSTNRTCFFPSLHTSPKNWIKIGIWCLLALGVIAPRESFAQKIFVKNQFVGAGVETNGSGLIRIYAGDPMGGRGLPLTYDQTSYLTIRNDNTYYTNTGPARGGVTLIGPSNINHPPDVILDNGTSVAVADTIFTTWKENGFDILQKVYPVAFTTSGAIVISISIVNHTQSPLSDVQAQYLLDNENGKHDDAKLLHQYGYFQNWQICPPKPMPSFCLSFENPPDSANVGVVGIGYYNDTFPPRPLGLIQPSLIEYGNWPVQSSYTWGWEPGQTGQTLADDATLMIGQRFSASSYVAGSNDSVTEIFRTAYGTPEWCFDHGNIVAFALYPQHLYWDSKTNSYTPNPFKVEAFLFNVKQSTASSVSIKQNVGSPVVIKTPNPTSPQGNQISVGGFAEAHWTDSVTISPGGCAKSFPIDIHFDVTANGVGTPIFTNPWACQIQVECPHPDTMPPAFKNAYTGCNPLMYDTATIQENNTYDLGLQSVTVSSPDLQYPADYSYTLSPAPSATPPQYNCVKTPVQVFLHQIDTFKAGHIVLTHTDCAGNISRDTICFTAHAPLPDKTPPVFTQTTQNTDCHTRCTDWIITDSATTNTSIDRGIGNIVVSSTNMTVTGTTGIIAPSLRVDTLHICVVDTMQDGTITLKATDTSNNTSTQTITFCTTPDTKSPLFKQSSFDSKTSSYHLHVTDTTGWDRGIDSVWLESVANMSAAGLPKSLTCSPSFDFDLKVDDTNKCAHATIMARDCKGNITAPLKINYSKNTTPVVTASKTVLCSATDFAVLTVSGTFATYSWTNSADPSFSASGNPINVSKAGSYTVNVDDGIGCTASSTPVVIIFDPATPHVSPAGPITLCAPDSVELDAGTNFASYAWSDGSKQVGTTEKIWAKTSGTYSATVTNSNGCSGTTANVVVTINPKPAQPTITEANGILTTNATATQYQWLDSTQKIITGATSQSFTPSAGGTYYVVVTDPNGCSNTSLPYKNAGSTVISIDTVSAPEGSHISFKMSIESSTSMALGVSRTWNARLHFNKSLLIPNQKPIFDSTFGDTRFVGYSETTQATQGVFKELPFTAALGDSICTGITIDSFWWTPSLTVTKKGGEFCLTNLCVQGGTRLFNSDGRFSLSAPRPSPVQNNVTIDYSLIEQGHTVLAVSDLLGREVLRLVDADQSPGGYSITASMAALPAGTYIYSLRTPTLVQSHHLQIAR
jgi:hypothetical protein